jgi:ubiquinol-cytochrome c reductase core subunit 2
MREVELLGGEISSYHSRENLVLRAKFLREDLPYFTELLAEVISKTRYTCKKGALNLISRELMSV